MAGGKVTPNGRSNHTGTINQGGVAPLSHFMLTFSAPAGTPFAVQSGRKTNFIEKAFLKEKEKFVSWDQQGITNLAFRCERVSLPGRIIISSPFKEGNIGLVREYPTNTVYQPVDATFLMSKDYSEKIFFEVWQDLIVGPHRVSGDNNPQVVSRNLNYIDNYTCSMTIHCFRPEGGRNFKEVYRCTLREAYPRTIQDIQMDWSANDLVRLNVVFDYKYFEDETTEQFTSSATENQGGFLNTTGIGAGLSAFGGRLLQNVPASAQRRIGSVATGLGGGLNAINSVRNAASRVGPVSGTAAARVASRLF
tara:strand:- start:1117 stop:2037 length:921 start_codon:yes stop_codon:yes gene_type:complete